MTRRWDQFLDKLEPNFVNLHDRLCHSCGRPTNWTKITYLDGLDKVGPSGGGSLGGVQNCHHFHKSTQYAGRRGSMAAVCFKTNDKSCNALDFHTGSLKINIFKVRFWEGEGHKKQYSVYPLDNVDNSGRPLSGGNSSMFILCSCVGYWNGLPQPTMGDSSVTCVTFSQLFSSLNLCR